MLIPNSASILSGLLLVVTATAAPLISDNDDTSVTATKRSILNGKPPYTVRLYVEKVATTIETITCDNYEELFDELLRRNENWEKEWPGSFGWINSHVPKKGKGKRSVQAAEREVHPVQVFKDGPIERIEAFSEKELHDEVLKLNPNHDKEFDDLQQKWPDTVPNFGHKRSILPFSVPPATLPHGHPDYVYGPENEDYGFEERTVGTLDADVEASRTNRRATKINKGYDGWEAKPSCNKDSFGGKADYNHINELMDTLLMQSGKPKVGAGPKTCAIAGCKDGNSIWFCNDTNQDLTIGSYSEIQYAARIIRNNCATNNGGTNTLYSGQVFTTDQSWNVIIRGGC